MHWYLGMNVLDHELGPAEWLALPEQHLRTIRYGGVWHDGTGELTRLRELLHWYPDQIWRYILRAQWRRIDLKPTNLKIYFDSWLDNRTRSENR